MMIKELLETILLAVFGSCKSFRVSSISSKI
jgi:hypothetical protein